MGICGEIIQRERKKEINPTTQNKYYQNYQFTHIKKDINNQITEIKKDFNNSNIGNNNQPKKQSSSKIQDNSDNLKNKKK